MLAENEILLWDLRPGAVKPVLGPGAQSAPQAAAPAPVQTTQPQSAVPASAEAAPMPPLQSAGQTANAPSVSVVQQPAAPAPQPQAVSRDFAPPAAPPQDAPEDFAPLPPPEEFPPQGNAAESDPVYPNWHLRKKRADLYIDEASQAAYLQKLEAFVRQKGLSVQPYDRALHYLPYDCILCDRARAPVSGEGRCAFLDDGREAVWIFLKQRFGARLA